MPRNQEAPSFRSCAGKTNVPREITEPDTTSPFNLLTRIDTVKGACRPTDTCHNTRAKRCVRPAQQHAHPATCWHQNPRPSPSKQARTAGPPKGGRGPS